MLPPPAHTKAELSSIRKRIPGASDPATLDDVVGAVDPTFKTSFIGTRLNQKQFKGGKGLYTLAQVGQHNSEDDCWIVIENRVFDVTKLLPTHPGGKLPIISVAGRDVSQIFHSFHPKKVGDYYLRQYYVGDIAEADWQEVPVESEGTLESDYTALYENLVKEGLFERRPEYFMMVMARNLLLLATAVLFVLYGDRIAGDEWAYTFQAVVGGCLLGAFWQQGAFFGHDVGHTAITYSLYWDHVIGIICGNFLGGISIGWWKDNHYTHHVVTNSATHDPNIQHPPLMAVSSHLYDRRETKDGKPIESFYYGGKLMDYRGATAPKYQHFLLYPIMAIARINLYIQSYKYLLNVHTFRNRNIKWQIPELAGMVGFFVWTAILYSSLTWEQGRLTLMLVSHVVSGVLHVQIILSHFSVDNYEGVKYGDPVAGTRASDEDSWPALQLATTMNVTCPWYMDWFHGGLQFQNEHHLFPKMPRHNLRQASVKVQEFAKKHKLKYQTFTFYDANVRTLKHLRDHSIAFTELWDEAVAG